MDTLTFRSRIDSLLAALVFVPLGLSLGKTALRTLERGAGTSLVPLATSVMILAFVGWIFADTVYRITESSLLVRCGPFRISVPLAQIRRVRHTNSLLSAPALSLDRLAIEYGRGSTVVISPDDAAGFLAALKSRVADVQLP